MDDDEMLQAEIECLDVQCNVDKSSVADVHGVTIPGKPCNEVSQQVTDDNGVFEEDFQSDKLHYSGTEQFRPVKECQYELPNDERFEAEIMECLML